MGHGAPLFRPAETQVRPAGCLGTCWGCREGDREATYFLLSKEVAVSLCSKLSIYFVHTPGAEQLNSVHSTSFLCFQAYILYMNTLK